MPRTHKTVWCEKEPFKWTLCVLRNHWKHTKTSELFCIAPLQWKCSISISPVWLLLGSSVQSASASIPIRANNWRKPGVYIISIGITFWEGGQESAIPIRKSDACSAGSSTLKAYINTLLARVCQMYWDGCFKYRQPCVPVFQCNVYAVNSLTKAKPERCD